MTSPISRARRVLLALAIALSGASPHAARADTRPRAEVRAEAASWPHTMTEAGGSATIYEPQAISWSDLKTLTARAAVAITPEGAAAPFFGTIELTVATRPDLDTRLVTLTEPKLVSANFPTLDPAHAATLEARIRAVMDALPAKTVPLDTIMLSLKQPPAAAEAPVSNDPPRIFYSGRPASLVVFDGDPVLAPIAGNTLSFAVNTNWDVFKDAAGAWYLRVGPSWLTAQAATGPWSAVATLPPVFQTLPKDANFAAARAAVPAKPFADGAAASILVSTVPAEIIVTDGPPKLVDVAGVALQAVANTQARVFFDPADAHFYYLVSGRWFSASSLDGPWSFATPNLPAEFAKLSPDGQYAPVLASVPGTPQAQEAVIQAQIPRQATLKRNAMLTVVYGGPPRFAPIPGTTIEYAVNTHFEVLRIGPAYYACYQGAWFKAASPNGPWALADSVPPEVASIPPRSPLYPVTYVTVYAATPYAVTYGYSSGYVMGYVSAGVVVYGTGYYYPPVVVAGVVPAYYPYPYSYAGGVYYNSASGAWARGGAVYGPYGGVAKAGTAYNPATGAWASGAAIYGPNGGAGAFSAYNPSTGSYAHGSAAWGNGGGSANASWYNARSGVAGSTNQNSNPYGRWGSSTLTGPNATVNTQSGSNARGGAGAFSSTTGAQGAGVHGANGRNAGVAKGANGDVYAGADGNVYRHSSSGWSKYDNGSWNPVQKPTPPAGGGGQSAHQATASNASANGRGTTQASAPSRPSSSYGQLEQDRQARSFGSGYQRGGGGGQGRSFGRRR